MHRVCWPSGLGWRTAQSVVELGSVLERPPRPLLLLLPLLPLLPLFPGVLPEFPGRGAVVVGVVVAVVVVVVVVVVDVRF